MIRKVPCILLLIAILLGIMPLASCAKKAPYEKLIELRESYYDTNGEWSALYSKYSKPIDKKKREEISKERNDKEKKLREELGLYKEGTLQEFKEICKLSEEDMSSLREETPLMRIGEPREIAAAALWLASDDASFITGEVLNISGGFVI